MLQRGYKGWYYDAASDAWRRNGSDPNFSSVSFLSRCNQFSGWSAGSPAYTSIVGNTVIGNVFDTHSDLDIGVSRFSLGASLFTDGTSARYFKVTQVASELTFGTADFTIEFWHYLRTPLSANVLMDLRTTASAELSPLLYYDTAGKPRYFTNGADQITGTVALATSSWHFWALSRVSGSTRLYVDGVQAGSTYADSNSYVSRSNWYFGGQVISGTPGIGQAGNFNDIRITKGVGRYAATACPVPTWQFPDH